jgi:hypothetical protein
MSDLEQRKPKRLTFRDLIIAAQSGDASVRKRAYVAYQAWVKAAPRINESDRLTHMQRDVLDKIFKEKAFGSVQRTRSA